MQVGCWLVSHMGGGVKPSKPLTNTLGHVLKVQALLRRFVEGSDENGALCQGQV